MFNELEGRKGITNQVSRFHLPATSPYPLQGEAQRASTTSQTARIQEARLWASKYKQGDDSDFNVPGTNAVGQAGCLPGCKPSPLPFPRELNQTVGGNQVSSAHIPRPVPPAPSFLFMDPDPTTAATKEKADISICQHMT